MLTTKHMIKAKCKSNFCWCVTKSCVLEIYFCGYDLMNVEKRFNDDDDDDDDDDDHSTTTTTTLLIIINKNNNNCKNKK